MICGLYPAIKAQVWIMSVTVHPQKTTVLAVCQISCPLKVSAAVELMKSSGEPFSISMVT